MFYKIVQEIRVNQAIVKKMYMSFIPLIATDAIQATDLPYSTCKCVCDKLKHWRGTLLICSLSLWGGGHRAAASWSAVVLTDLPLDVRQFGAKILRPPLLILVVSGLQTTGKLFNHTFHWLSALLKFSALSLTFFMSFSLMYSFMASWHEKNSGSRSQIHTYIWFMQFIILGLQTLLTMT